MFLTLNERVLADLGLLSKLTPQYVAEFCQVSLDFLNNGAKRGMFQAAASGLGCEPEAVAGAVFAMTDVMLEAARHNLSQSEFSGSLGDVTMTEQSKKIISEFYNTNLRSLRDRLGAGSTGSSATTNATTTTSSSSSSSSGSAVGGALQTPEFRNLEWRLEVQVASRHMHDKMQPTYTMRLDTAFPLLESSSEAADTTASPSSGSNTSSSTGAGNNAQQQTGGLSSFVFTSDFETLQRAAEQLEEANAELKTSHSRRVLRYIR